jgi:hypothetical protein
MANPTNRMALGELNPHRAGLTAVDASPPTVKGAGFETRGYKGIIVEAVVKAGAPTAIAVDVYFWSEGAAAWVKDATIASLTSASTSQWTVANTGGRRCWIGLKTLTGGGTIDVNVGPLEKTVEDFA